MGTYAYVNPVVAVILGYFLGGETIGLRTICGTALVLVSVVVITLSPSKKAKIEVREISTEYRVPSTDN